MDYKIYEVLLGEYKSRMDMLSEALIRGNCPTIEEYRYICGQLRGLEAACAIIEDLQHKTEEDFDD
jgi:hypothetical protein